MYTNTKNVNLNSGFVREDGVIKKSTELRSAKLGAFFI